MGILVPLHPAWQRHSHLADSQLPDILDKRHGPQVGVLVVDVRFFVVLLEPPLLLRKVASDVVVEEELREDVKFLGEVLVRVVHGCVEDSKPVLADAAADRVDADCVEVLGPPIRAALDEDLLVKVVVEAGNEYVNVAHNLEDIETLVEGPHGEVVIGELKAKLFLGQVLHFAVRQPVMESNRCKVVEAALQVEGDPLVDVDDNVEDGKGGHEDEGSDLRLLLSDGVRPFHMIEVFRVDVQPEVVLDITADLVNKLGAKHIVQDEIAVLRGAKRVAEEVACVSGQ